MTTIDEILGGIRLPRLSVTIYTRGDLLGESTRISEEHAKLAKTIRDDGAANDPTSLKRDELWKQLQEIEDEMSASAVTFMFEALSATEYRRLLESHPPRDGDAGFNPETFPTALIAACCVEPEGMTLEKAERLLDRIPDGELAKLWQTAIAVNTQQVTVPKFVRRSAVETLRDASSSTAADTVSPEVFSSDE